MTPEITLILIILTVSVLMLPVVMGLAQHTNTPPSRLLLPLAYGSLLDGLTTQIGTPQYPGDRRFAGQRLQTVRLFRFHADFLAFAPLNRPITALCSRRRRPRSKCRRKQSAGAVLCVPYPNCRGRIF
jgi:hypothetical protein